MRSLRRAALVAVALALPLAACGDDDDEPTATDGQESTDGGSADGEEAGDGGSDAASELSFTAVDIEFEEKEATGAAGELAVTLTNDGEVEHSWLVEDHEDDLRLHVEANGDTDEGTISLEAGEYTYYCDVTGHRAAGMEGTLTVE